MSEESKPRRFKQDSKSWKEMVLDTGDMVEDQNFSSVPRTASAKKGVEVERATRPVVKERKSM